MNHAVARWQTMGPDDRGLMVSTRTTRSCETLLRSSTFRGHEYGGKAPSGSNFGGRVEISHPDGKDMGCEACRLG